MPHASVRANSGACTRWSLRQYTRSSVRAAYRRNLVDATVFPVGVREVMTYVVASRHVEHRAKILRTDPSPDRVLFVRLYVIMSGRKTDILLVIYSSALSKGKPTVRDKSTFMQGCILIEAQKAPSPHAKWQSNTFLVPQMHSSRVTH